MVRLGQSVWAVAGGALAAGLIAAIPLFLVTYPPLQDLPNHLARIAVLSAPSGDPLLDYYAMNWAVLPNLATDLILLALGKLMPLALASKLLLVTCGALWLGGPLVLHWAVYRRLSLVPLVASAFLLNRILQMGFLNYLFGTALLVWCFAAWILLTPRTFGVRALEGAAMALVLFFCHLYAVGVFAVAVVLWEVLPSGVPGDRRFLSRLGLPAIVLLPPLVALLVGPHVPASQLYLYPDYGSVLGFLTTKLDLILRFASPDGVVGGLAVIVLAVVIIGAARVRGALDRRVGTIIVVLLLLFLALPSRLLSGSHADWRIVGPLVLFASAWPVLKFSRWQTAVYSALLLAFLGAQTTDEYRRWRAAEANYLSVRSLEVLIPPGSRLAYLTVGFGNGKRGEDASFLHYGSYGTIENDLVVPSLFAFPTQQPILVRREFKGKYPQLERARADGIGSVAWTEIRAFDYAILALKQPLKRRTDLTEIAAAGAFHLYKVTR